MLIPYEQIAKKILLIRNKKVMLDRDLAEIYGVSTKVLNQAVKRNIERFPEDFMLKLTKTEKNKLVTICDRFKNLKHSAVNPYAFTEQGVAMLSSVLNGQRAIMVNIVIMRTFAKLRKILASHKDLLKKIEDIEKKYDSQFKAVFEAIRQLVREEEKPKRNIGFK